MHRLMHTASQQCLALLLGIDLPNKLGWDVQV